MRDPNILFTTIAQLSATFVAILGGFLLTYGLARQAERRRNLSRLDRLNRLIRYSAAEREAQEQESDTYEQAATRECREVYRRLLMGELTGEEALKEQQRIATDLMELAQDHVRGSKETIRQLEADEFDDALILGAVAEQERQLHVIAIGLILLTMLGLVGIGIPLLVLPVAPTDELGWREWFARRGFLALLIAILNYVWFVTVESSDTLFVRSRRRLIASGLWWLGILLLFFVPPAGMALWIVFGIGCALIIGSTIVDRWLWLPHRE